MKSSGKLTRRIIMKDGLKLMYLNKSQRGSIDLSLLQNILVSVRIVHSL